MSLPVSASTNPCSGCGKCCKDFGGDGVSTGLSLFPDEFRLYKQLAAARGLFFRSVPKVVAVERSSGRGVVSHYVVLTQPCVFYEEGVGCSIYSQRPLVCQAFPYSISLFDDLLVGGSSAREGFLVLAARLGAATPGVVAARAQLARRDALQAGVQLLLEEGVLSLQTAFYRGLVDVDVLLEK